MSFFVFRKLLQLPMREVWTYRGSSLSAPRATIQPWPCGMDDVLERAVRAVSEQAAAAKTIVDEALEAGLDGSHPVTVLAKMLRLELLN